MEEGINTKKYIFWGIIAGIIALSYLLLKDLLIALVTSVILTFIALPIHKKISKYLNEKISAALTVAIILFIFIGILSIFVTSFISQLISFLSKENITNLLGLLSNIINSDIIQENLSQIINELGKALLAIIPQKILSIPMLLLNLFVIFFTMYFLLIEWDKLEKKLIDIIPFEKKEYIIKKIKSQTNNILSGTLFIAILEMIIAAIVLRILGVGPYLVLAFAIGLLAFIPAMGPAIIWIPLAIIEFLYGKTGIAIGVVIMGVILSTGIDFMLRAKLLGSRTGTHPIIMLLGLIGGIQLFGFIGIIIGPLILSILVTIIENIPKTNK
ncbi:MAG: AI-2E family transporter [Nanoarchaeota archaeon]|nr:AI-2E family transporter [Nanoarchaeota archaeon]